MADIIESLIADPDYKMVQQLKGKILENNIFSIVPVLSPLTEIGFTYPQIESMLKISTGETITVLDCLVRANEIEKQLSSEIQSCPSCHSPNLEPVQGCPKCSSSNIARGRILEHFHCGYLGLEEEFVGAGKYICPKCKNDVRFLGTDYRSLGMSFKCKDCHHIFTEALAMRHCLKCTDLFPSSKAIGTTVFSYHLSEEQKIRLKFDLGPKVKLIDLLKKRGYIVTEKAKIKGSSKSGAEHVFDLLAQRNDGLISHTVCADIIVNARGEDIGLEDVFKFDNKAYDLGIPDKVIFALPRLGSNAMQLAGRQQIKVFQDKDLDKLLDSARSYTASPSITGSFSFETRSKFLQKLESNGYQLKEEVRVKGRSGVEHNLDILAYRDDGVIAHVIDIGIIAEQPQVSIDTVFLYDTRAFDTAIHDKVLIASPSLTPEAKQFALHQKIKVIEVADQSRLQL